MPEQHRSELVLATTAEESEVEGPDPGLHLGKLAGGGHPPVFGVSESALEDPPPAPSAPVNDGPRHGAVDAPPLPIAGLVHGLHPLNPHLNGVEWSAVLLMNGEGGRHQAHLELRLTVRRHRERAASQRKRRRSGLR